MAQFATYSILSIVKLHFTEAMTKWGLEIKENGHFPMILGNDHCHIHLLNEEDVHIGFGFWDAKDVAAKEYYLWEYMMLLFPKSGHVPIPSPPKAWQDGDKLDYYMKKYNQVVMEGYLDGPLQGDFSWNQRFDALKAENDKLMNVFYDLIRLNHPEKSAIDKKVDSRDPTWKDDVRRIMKEKGW